MSRTLCNDLESQRAIAKQKKKKKKLNPGFSKEIHLLHKRDSLMNEETLTEFAVVTSFSKKRFPSDRLCVFALSVDSLEEFETPTPWPGLQP